jgi:hypothetical protein
VAGFALAVLATLIFGLLIRWSGHTPRLYEAGLRPASDMGLSAAYGSWPEARGSTFQLLLNVVLLIAVGALGLRLQGSFWRGRTARAAARARRPSPAAPAHDRVPRVRRRG